MKEEFGFEGTIIDFRRRIKKGMSLVIYPNSPVYSQLIYLDMNKYAKYCAFMEMHNIIVQYIPKTNLFTVSRK